MPGEEIFHLSVSELAKRIEAKKLSPVELTQIYLDRSQKLGPRYNAYALLTPEIASNKRRQRKRKSGAGTIAARCTEFLTPQQTCSQPKEFQRHGAPSLMRTRYSITTRR